MLAAGVVTGRAVVVMFSVEEAGLLLVNVTELLVKLHDEAEGSPEHDKLILELYSG
jgi:hypothetical protein